MDEVTHCHPVLVPATGVDENSGESAETPEAARYRRSRRNGADLLHEPAVVSEEAPGPESRPMLNCALGSGTARWNESIVSFDITASRSSIG